MSRRPPTGAAEAPAIKDGDSKTLESKGWGQVGAHMALKGFLTPYYVISSSLLDQESGRRGVRVTTQRSKVATSQGPLIKIFPKDSDQEVALVIEKTGANTYSLSYNPKDKDVCDIVTALDNAMIQREKKVGSDYSIPPRVRVEVRGAT